MTLKQKLNNPEYMKKAINTIASDVMSGRISLDAPERTAGKLSDLTEVQKQSILQQVKQGVTKYQVAKAYGIDRGTFSKFLKGRGL
jgi:hypothetical protein